MATPRNKSHVPKPHAMSSEQVSESNTHHERRFAQIDRDIFSVKTDVGVLQADVKTLAAGQLALQSSQDRGFNDIKDTLQAKSQEQPKISIAMLMSIFGVMITIVAVGVGAFWSVVLLLADPIRNEVREHKAATAPFVRDLSLLSERADQVQVQLKAAIDSAETSSAHQHDAQEKQIAALHAEIENLRASELRHSELHGKQLAYEEMRRINEQRIYEHLEMMEKRIAQ